jgi:hypothetical protein
MSDEKKKQCFIIGPIGSPDDPHHDKALGRLQQIFEPAAISNGLVPKRADQDSEPGRITDKIVNDIYESEIIIVDLWPVCDNRPNPNVMYEMGIAHLFDKRVVGFMLEGQDLPFDIAGLRNVAWNESFKTMNASRDNLSTMIGSVLKMKSGFSPVVTTLNTKASIDALDNDNPLKDIVAYLDQKFAAFEQRTRTHESKTQFYVPYTSNDLSAMLVNTSNAIEAANETFTTEHNLMRSINSNYVTFAEVIKMTPAVLTYFYEIFSDLEHIRLEIVGCLDPSMRAVIKTHRPEFKSWDVVVLFSLLLEHRRLHHLFHEVYDERIDVLLDELNPEDYDTRPIQKISSQL